MIARECPISQYAGGEGVVVGMFGWDGVGGGGAWFIPEMAGFRQPQSLRGMQIA